MDKDLIAWKSNAWKEPVAGPIYQGRVTDQRGTNQLKNRIELDLCQAHVIGPEVLDVGIGSGRASLPLARAGMRVTGVDSSVAMLDQARQQAGETPIELLEGDLADLDFPDARFDSVMSINVLVHFPHWREVLAEWTRVVREGGRIVFDVHSQDHHDAARAAKQLPPEVETGNFSDFESRVRVSDLVETADALGLTLVAVTPYNGGNANAWLSGSKADSPQFNRLLSWMPGDKRLFDFALFLEQQFLAHLTSRATGRFMVVLDKRADPAANQAWLERDLALNLLLEDRLDLTGLEALVPAFDAHWRDLLNAHLTWPRNRILLYRLLSAWEAFPGHLRLDSFLDPDLVIRMEAWRAQDAIDQVTTRTLRDLTALPALSALLSHKGVPLLGSLEYDLTRSMLVQYFHVLR